MAAHAGNTLARKQRRLVMPIVGYLDLNRATRIDVCGHAGQSTVVTTQTSVVTRWQTLVIKTFYGFVCGRGSMTRCAVLIGLRVRSGVTGNA